MKDRFKERIISDRKGFRTLEKFQEALPALLVEFPERDPQFGVTHHLCQYILSGHGERLPVPLRIHCFVLFQFSSFSASVDKKAPQTAGHAGRYLSTFCNFIFFFNPGNIGGNPPERFRNYLMGLM